MRIRDPESSTTAQGLFKGPFTFLEVEYGKGSVAELKMKIIMAIIEQLMDKEAIKHEDTGHDLSSNKIKK